MESAIGRDLVETSPFAGLSKASAETQRDRILTEDEIRAVWAGCDAPVVACLRPVDPVVM
ncbi:MAG TPA: hypothetical protein VFM88_02460 [Vicinamibacteria bacterium]|nr:hypothetical protein [Vicinamibacteria bacterium]